MNPDPHGASAITFRCWSQEIKSRQPASAGVKTVTVNNVE
jgi:hypothetical protein